MSTIRDCSSLRLACVAWFAVFAAMALPVTAGPARFDLIPGSAPQDRPADTCPVGSADCGIGCTNIVSDPANCGGCGILCPGSGAQCTNGMCSCSGAGVGWCGLSCTDFQTDRANCGGCGTVCATGFACVAGTCDDTVFTDGFDGS